MRKLILIAALCWAGPVVADKAQATQLLVNNLVSMGGDTAQATTIARCFVDRMTDAQAMAFVSAQTSAERETVVGGIADKDGASACVQTAMGG